jgi:hypothetical protein
MEAPRALPFLKQCTPTLSAIVAQYERTLPAEELGAFLEHLGRLHAGFEAVLSAAPAGPLRAEAVHMLVAKAVTDLQGVTPTCARGCAACCHYEVEVTRDEAELLARVVVEGLEVDRARLARQADRSRGGPAWAELAVEENRCVFLGPGEECRVYPHRPSACRRLLVVSPAVECGRPGGAPRPITIPVAELVISTALSLPDNGYTSLAKGVSAELIWAEAEAAVRGLAKVAPTSP